MTKRFEKIVLMLAAGLFSLAVITLAAGGGPPDAMKKDPAIKLMKKHKCLGCHNIGALGLAAEPDEEEEKEAGEEKDKKTPPDLSGVGTQKYESKFIKEFIGRKVKNERGKKHKKKFKGSDKDGDEIVAFLQKLVWPQDDKDEEKKEASGSKSDAKTETKSGDAKAETKGGDAGE